MHEYICSTINKFLLILFLHFISIFFTPFNLKEEERCLREEHIAFRQREARIERDRQKEIMLAMENAKKHVMTLFRQKCKLVLMRQVIVILMILNLYRSPDSV